MLRSMPVQPIPYPLRMPEKLREQLTESARSHGRSLNAEILGILQEAVRERQQLMSVVDVELLADILAAKLAARLEK